MNETEDIEELEALRAIITPDMEKGSRLLIGGVKSQIGRKISNIRQKNAIDRIKNDIPTGVLGIASDLVNGEIDMQKANSILDDEAKKKVASSPKSRFALTEEQHRKQMLTQIRTVIMQQPDKYKIRNPHEAIKRRNKKCRD